ncbi:EF-hand domain-containing protein [Sphingomonas humi]|uniref:EF-hand domain-containing protein n=1 Tax=Sphingomonas humi TaxID=335630 RepID=A0ABP7RXY5_9SPHN
MIKTSLFGLLVAGSTLAAAQTVTPTPATTPVTTPSGTQPATPATPADPATGTAATPATPATPATTDSLAPTEGGTSVDSVVSAEWSTYDANNNQSLSRTEFDKWVTALQSASGGKAPTKGYLTSAFKKADKDNSGGVSQPELVAFLGS